MRAGCRLVQIRDNLEQVANDEDEDDHDQDAGKVDLLFMDGTCMGRKKLVYNFRIISIRRQFFFAIEVSESKNIP